MKIDCNHSSTDAVGVPGHIKTVLFIDVDLSPLMLLLHVLAVWLAPEHACADHMMCLAEYTCSKIAVFSARALVRSRSS